MWTSPTVTQVDQPKPQFEPTTRTWSASNWAPSVTLPTDDWPPGDYVLKLQATAGTVNLVPLTVRSATTRDAVVIVNENTTWQAYNRWGGTSLYRGPTGFADRAYAVSMDRPIDYGMGTGDYWGNEAPLGRLAEKLGLPVAYVTDTDLHADPHLLDGARAVISLGHDEYYSQAMWDALVAARDKQGTNLAFLGANAMYRHIRLGPTPIGPDRLETDYKDARIDPMLEDEPRRGHLPVASAARTPAGERGHRRLLPMQPRQGGHGRRAAGLMAARRVGTQGGRQARPAWSAPSTTRSLPASPRRGRSRCSSTHRSPASGHRQFSDAAYYTTASGAGVFASGTSSWICGLVYECTFHPQDQHLVDVVTTITTTLLQAFAAGPAGKAHPARDNLGRAQHHDRHDPRHDPVVADCRYPGTDLAPCGVRSPPPRRARR